MKLHLFNPENDLALALGCRHYTPPPHAVAIHNAGALLPMWWAEEGDSIIAPEQIQTEALRLAGRFGLNGAVGGDVRNVTQVAPWGWSLDAKRQLLRAGVDGDILPDDSSIERMRQLSHRRMSVEILTRLDSGSPIALETTDPDVVVEMERNNPGCYVKSPWSSSGRGVFCARSLDENALRRRAEGIIHRQGSVMVERGLDKVADFAALFHSDGVRVSFRGLSMFTTEARGMYSGNVVAPQSYIESRLSDMIDFDSLMEIISREEEILTELTATAYNGWMGVDMMVYNDGSRRRVMPCVELNLRMTMGVVALKVSERLGVGTPHFLAWEHRATTTNNNDETPDSLIILPPTDGFTLRLTKI